MIREARHDDVAALMRIEHECFDVDAFSSAEFLYRIYSPANSVFVALASTPVSPLRIIGYATVDYPRCSRVANFSALAVLPERRGGKWGRKLTMRIEDDVRASGCTALVLECRPHLVPYHARHGFRRIGEMNDWYKDGADAACMWKDIR